MTDFLGPPCKFPFCCIPSDSYKHSYKHMDWTCTCSCLPCSDPTCEAYYIVGKQSIDFQRFILEQLFFMELSGILSRFHINIDFCSYIF